MSMTSQKVKLELFLDAPPASSPAPRASSPTPLQRQHHQLLLQLQPHSHRRTGRRWRYGTPWRARLVEGLTSTSSPELTTRASPPEELLEDGVEEDEGEAPPDLVKTSLLDS